MILAAENRVDLYLGREEISPPGNIQILKSLHRQNSQIDRRGIRQPHRDELREQRRKQRPAFHHILVKRRALLAAQAAQRHQQRAILRLCFGQRPLQIIAPDHFLQGLRHLRLRWAQDFIPVGSGQ